MKHLPLILIVLLTVFFSYGCLNPIPTDNPNFTNPIMFGPEWLDSMIEVAQAMSMANYASTPVNPYVIPVGVGLAGLTAVLEALRRTEKSGRKHAEHELNNGNNKK